MLKKTSKSSPIYADIIKRDTKMDIFLNAKINIIQYIN